MFDYVRPHRRQTTRLPHPWDSLGKNTGVGCHFLLQCMKVKSESEVAQLCPTLSDSMDCSLPGSSSHGIFQARVLEWAATALTFKNWLSITILIHDICHSLWGKECHSIFLYDCSDFLEVAAFQEKPELELNSYVIQSGVHIISLVY